MAGMSVMPAVTSARGGDHPSCDGSGQARLRSFQPLAMSMSKPGLPLFGAMAASVGI